MTTLRDFTHENAKLVKEIGTQHGLPTDAAIKIVDMSLAYDLHMQSETERNLTDLITKLLDEDAAANNEETDDK